MKLIVGLGNPGKRYEETRHNAGFQVVDRLVRQLPEGRRHRLDADELFETRRDVERVLLLKPGTFMNRSGSAVTRCAARFHVAPEQVLVVLDDLELPPGRLRLRAGGGTGGHRGLEDIARSFSADVHRLRVGIGRPPPAGEASSEMDVESYVLGRFSAEEMQAYEATLERAAQAALCWVDSGIAVAMDRYNGDPEQERRRREKASERRPTPRGTDTQGSS